MIEVGIWERDEGILDAVARRLPPSAARLRSGRHPAELAEGVLDLLVVSPGALGWAGAGAVDCRTVLLPGGAGPAGPRIAHRPGGQLRHLPSGHPDLFQFGRGSDLPGTAAGAGDAAGNGGGAAGDGAPLPAGSLPSALPGHSRNPAAVGHAPGTAYGAPNGGPIKQEETAFCRSIEAAGCVSPVDLPVYSPFLTTGIHTSYCAF